MNRAGGILLLMLVVCVGCRQERPSPTAEARGARRAFSGAPPVISHAPQSGRCTNCHTPTGMEVGGMGIAPANPHLRTSGLSAESNCRQCHVFVRTESLLADSSFAGHVLARHGDRGQPLAAPTLPHRPFMHEDCAACHAGIAARAEVKCSHPERARCLQCHVAQVEATTTGL